MKNLIFFLTIVFSVFTVYAHRVDVFPYVEGEKVIVEGYFSDGTPTKNSKVEVYNNKGEKIIEGKTDENGIFSFPLPEKADKLKIVLNASMGHRAETIFQIEGEKEEKAVEQEETTQQVEREISQSKMTRSDEIKKVVEDAVKPLIKIIEEERRRTRISDIVGGIGFILGIFGVIALLYRRK